MLVNRSFSRRLTGVTTFFRSFTATTGNIFDSNVVDAEELAKVEELCRAKELSTIKTRDQLLTSYVVTPPIKKWPQDLTPRRLVQMINRPRKLDLALRIFHHAGQYHPHFTHTCKTYQAIILKLCQGCEFEAVETLLTQLRRSRIDCDEHLFEIVIRYYGFSGKPKMALKTFLRISKEFRVRMSVRSFHTLLNALIQNKEFNLVHILFRNCRRKFDIMPNVCTCNLVIKALCMKGDLEGAVRIVDEIPGMGMVPNADTYITVLDGYIVRGDMIGAKRVFDGMLDRGWLPDVTTCNIFMDGYVKVERLVDAIKVMDQMKKNHIKPNDITYGLMIEALCQEKKSGEATNLLHEMIKKKYIPSSTVCCKLINLLCEEGKVEYSCNLWKMLVIKNCIPDNAILSTLIHWLCKEGKVQEAGSLFNEFDGSYVPSLLTYNTLIAGMCENGELCEAGRIWDDMVEKGRKPNILTYNILMEGFCRGGNAKGGIRILQEMLDKRCLPNKLTFSILINVLSDSGCEADILEVLHLVASKGHVIGTVCSAAFVTKFVSDTENPGVVLDKILLENVI